METLGKSNYNNAFARKLRELLEKHPKTHNSTTRTRLAKELGVKQQTVSQWADGSTTPSLEHLKPLASYFDISIDELVTGVSYTNERLHVDTGLSNNALESLKQLKSKWEDMDRINIIFLNMIIETMNSPEYGLSFFTRRIVDLLMKKEKKSMEEKDRLDFEFYLIIRKFEELITALDKSKERKEYLKGFILNYLSE